MKTMAIIAIVLVALVATGCCWLFREKQDDAPAELMWKPKGRVAVVFFSQSKVGNTRTVAEWIADLTGGELVEIEPVEAYPEPYGETLRKAQADMNAGVVPEIKPVKSLDGFDTVFLGSPVWYGTFAPPVRRFLSQNSLAGKTVIPFCTHGGGGEGRTFADVKASCPAATVLTGFSARGSNQIERRIGVGVKRTTSRNGIVEWLNSFDEAAK